MFPNKNGYWYVLGFLLAILLSFIPIYGDLIAFFIASIAITAIFHNKRNKNFKGWEIIEIGATCSLTVFLLSIIFLLLFIQQFPILILLVALITRFIAVSGGIWVYNKMMGI
jgi:hypothetical protein